MGSKVIIVEKTWMCGCGRWGEFCGKKCSVGSQMGVLEETQLCGCGQWGEYRGENVDFSELTKPFNWWRRSESSRVI